MTILFIKLKEACEKFLISQPTAKIENIVIIIQIWLEMYFMQ